MIRLFAALLLTILPISIASAQLGGSSSIGGSAGFGGGAASVAKTISIDSGNCANSVQTTNSVACTVTATAGDTFAVGVVDRNGLITGVSDPTNGTYTNVFYANDATAPSWTGQWYFIASATGTVTVTATASASEPWLTITVLALKPSSGGTIALDTGPATQHQTATTNVANPTCGSAQSPTQDNEVIVAFLMMDNDTTASAGTNYTLGPSLGVNQMFSSYWVQTTATATNGPFTAAADDWTEGCMAFKVN